MPIPLEKASAMSAVRSFLGGRAPRPQYWMSVGAFLLGAIAVTFVLPPAWASLVSLPFWVVIGARRLHDFGRTGWWTLLPATLGFALGMVRGLGIPVNPQIHDLVISLVGLAIIIIIGSVPGHRTANRFGPPPGKPVDDVSVFD